MTADWQSLMRDWEKTEQELRSLADNASERPGLEQQLAALKHRIDAFVQDRQKSRRPKAGELTAVAIKRIR